ncbi:hypothetical protein SAMN05660657_05057 [Geodermatophilus amargosae]|uniref:Uncharacterized protein n=1 Tax=Geodermatophilus amargosae TaxID=1296565 RepID=A0A1I7CYW5_9ACTN|nr:hypothetical protein SAMN05660657_05057 [Geodermatophilus amargosae]
MALTAAITFATTWRWPTLRRRVQEHAALLKELPPETGEPLRKLLDDETRRLAARDRRRLEDPAVVAVLYLNRFLVSLTSAVVASLIVISIVVPEENRRPWLTGFLVIAVLVGLSNLVLMGWTIRLYRRRKKLTQGSGRNSPKAR